jgi:hypothetical protein
MTTTVSKKKVRAQWEGVIPAITTPFRKDGKLDAVEITRQCRWMVASGCIGIVPCGSLGEGATLTYDESLIIPNRDRSVRDGAIDPWTAPRYEKQRRTVVEFARSLGVSPDAAWKTLPVKAREQLLRSKSRAYTGIFPFLEALEEKRYKQYIRIFLRKYQSARTCRDCGGSTLQPDAMAVRIQDLYGVEGELRIGGGRVPLVIEVLAPNQRPIQVTQNLSNFWKESYPKIKQELSRKYPRHEWR